MLKISPLSAKRYFALAVALLMLGACGLRGPAYHEDPAPDVAKVVDMTNLLNFSPAEIRIQQGDLVEWRNVSLVKHTVTAVPGEAENPANVALPEGAQPFDSGYIPAGQVYRHRFAVPGTYRYFCRPHEGMGMVGTVIVEPIVR